ncbi:MAG: single-stranded DNA-binding protein [Anaplasmataceae bacterium]|nr:single-stranded DNA-binding protein [Anaplasmataceae bacterium]
MNLNKVYIIGRLTADPQLRSTPQGQSVATFSIATTRFWTDPSGAKKEQTEFHNVVVWGRQAEVASQFLNKGSVALVEGRLTTRSWQDKQGMDRKTTEIICERLQFGPRSQSQSSSGQNFSGGRSMPVSPKNQNTNSDEVKEVLVEDIPSIDIEDVKAEDLPF